MADSSRQKDFTASGFVALRTPLLPFDEILLWAEGLEAPGAVGDPAQLESALAADRARLRNRLRTLVTRPEVREALFVASPSLEESIEVWLGDPETERGQKIERAIVRYFVRMAGRATPFGLFAGCSVGALGDQTNLVVGKREDYRRHTRLDMDYLSALTDVLGRDPAIKKVLRYRPNSSLYRAAGRLRYVETRLSGQVRSHHLVAVETSDYLDATLERARDGALPADLAEALVASDPDITLSEAAEYVEQLIDGQLLVSELSPAVTGPEPVHELVAHLNQYPDTKMVAGHLDEARAALDAIDAAGLGVAPRRYRSIARRLEQLPAKVELSRLFQADMVKPSAEATLGRAQLAEIVRGLEVLHRLSGAARGDRLASFRRAFAERYLDREVPLVQVLDEEVGIGFERSTVPQAEASPLLEGLVFPAAPREETTPWGARQALLLRKLGEARARGEREIVLEPADLKRMESADPPPLPDAFAAMVTLSAASEGALRSGDFRVVLGSVYGPSGANLLGRFCHLDGALQQQVEKHLRAEEALNPEVVFAEVVHLPEGRVGNILSRPLLREYEIPFLGRSGAPRERRIPVTDLLVSVVNDRVVLRSARLGREVIPRLTSAHNITHPRNLGLYRFLCMLQWQGVAAALSWDWGVFESEPFLPRVVTGRVVLARARWLLDGEELQTLAKSSGAVRVQALQKWRVEQRVPRFVALADADNELPVDLDNVLSIETLAHLIKNRSQARLVEMYPGPDQLCARGPEGRFVHELVVPFIRKREVSTAKPRRPKPSLAGAGQRCFAPGSQWLYAKLYTGTSTADQLLRQVVGPVARKALDSGAADLWFFIRYADPDWHLRLRFQGTPEKLHAHVQPALQAAVTPLLEKGYLWRVQFDTYEREVERYGGSEGVTLAERIFHADSEAVLAIVELLSGDEGAEARWRLALRGVDMLLGDLGLDLDAKRGVLKRVRQAFGREFQADTTYLKQQLSDKYRKERKSLEKLLDPANDEESPFQPGLAILQRRSERLAPIVTELRACEQAGGLALPLMELAPSYIHMHANRLLRSAQRAQELVIYDFLHRLYQSRAARMRKGR